MAAKRRSKRRTKSRKSKSKSKKSKSKGKRKPFGGYAISFSGRKETVEEVFGSGKITPSEMTKRIWKFVKSKRLASQ